jgi:hypothetical protein
VSTAAWIKFPEAAKAQLIASVKSIKIARDLGPTEAIIEVPRYQEFTTDVRTLVGHGARFSQFAGNELIVISAIAPSGSITPESSVQMLLKQPILMGQGRTRVVLLVRVSGLNEVLASLERQGLKVEHLYNY